MDRFRPGRMVLVALAVVSLVQAQDGSKPQVDQARVDAAIEKGCEWLLKKAPEIVKEFPRGKRYQAEAIQSYVELVVLTLAHSGFSPETDTRMKDLVEVMVKKEIQTTYTAALQAMALQKIHPKKYQWRIAQCGRFLIENQCENGQWDYGEKVDVSDIRPPAEEPRPIETEATKKPAVKKYGTETQRPPVVVLPGKRKKGPPSGDNSNSQYAALGLRACMDSGIHIPRETLVKAREWWIKSQNKDGGWGYLGDASYGSMSVGGVGSVAIYDFYLQGGFQGSTPIQKGLDWIARNYDLKTNPKNPTKGDYCYYYYLYGLERAGLLIGTEKFGTHEWYPEGATMLLGAQRAEGFWINSNDVISFGGICDTCFAILFLRRGTTPLVKIATEPTKKNDK